MPHQSNEPHGGHKLVCQVPQDDEPRFRSSRRRFDAKGAINGFISDGLFIGQSQKFINLLQNLAEEADEAQQITF
jgi:hypothetical protein